jgi:probable HAF family extracellular repeat protein
VGQVVGRSATATGEYHAFLWTPGGTDGVTGNTQMKDLGTLGGTDCTATGINDVGEVCGTSYLSGTTTERAFLWQSSTGMIDLGTLGGSQSKAYAINSGGQVTGQADTTSGKSSQFHAFQWTPSSLNGTTGQMKDLGALNIGSTFKNSIGYALTDAGSVVGTDGDNVIPQYAVYWPGTGNTKNLNSMIPANSGFGVLQSAAGINGDGQIVGYGELPNQPIWHAFLLTPSTAVKSRTAVVILSPGNVAISAADLGGRPFGLADETIHVTNGRRAAFDAASSSGEVRSVEQTRRNDSQMTNTRERLVRRTFENNDVSEWSLPLDATLHGVFLTKETH